MEKEQGQRKGGAMGCWEYLRKGSKLVFGNFLVGTFTHVLLFLRINLRVAQTNNWVAPTYMVSVEDKSLRGGGYKLKQAIWNAAHDTIAEWTQQDLTQCSLYGIRVYKSGAVLATHVDRLPLVSSAIINVAQDVDEPWPLEVIGHDGVAYNVTMEPGDMVRIDWICALTVCFCYWLTPCFPSPIFRCFMKVIPFCTADHTL